MAKAIQTVKYFFDQRNLTLQEPLRVLNFDNTNFSEENNALILDLFNDLGEIPFFVQKNRNEYIFKIVVSHDLQIPS